MVGFILGIILAIVGIIAVVYFIVYSTVEKVETKVRDASGEVVRDNYGRPITTSETKLAYPLRKWAGLLAIGVTVISVGLAFLGCFAKVETGNTGVITVFGRVEDRTLDAGFHLKAPWEKVVEMNNKVQKVSYKLSCFSSDIQEVEVTYTLNYQIKKQFAQELYKTVGIDYKSTVISPNVAESVKVITARYTAEALIGSRDELASRIEELLGDQLDEYNVDVVSTAIEDLDFTDEFTAAVEAKQVAVQNKLKAQTEQEQKTMEATQAAERAKIEAEASAQIAKIQAAGDYEAVKIAADSAEYQGRKEAAIAMQRLASINGWTVVTGDDGINRLYKADGSEVSDEELKEGSAKLIQYYYIDRWNGILPETYLGGDNANGLILNVGE